MDTERYQEPVERLQPATGKCSREIRLDKAGKPVRCNRPGWILLRGHNLCVEHGREQMEVVAMMTENTNQETA